MLSKEFQEYLVGKTIKSVETNDIGGINSGTTITLENGSMIYVRDINVALPPGCGVEPRYFVDERAGCIAIRDHWNTDPGYQGLHPDTEGVVVFEGADGPIDLHYRRQCVSDSQRNRLIAECKRLNNLRGKNEN